MWQRFVPTGTLSLGYTADATADALGDASAGDGVGRGGVAATLATADEGFAALGGEGVHAATVIATNAPISPNRPRGNLKTSGDLTERLAEGNVLD